MIVIHEYWYRSYQLNHRASVIKPRGLSNRSNWCFVNAILQALLACPPFYNLMKSVPKDLLYGADTSAGVEHQGDGTNMKILAAVHSFFAEFAPLENFPKLNNKRRKNEDLPQVFQSVASSLQIMQNFIL